MKQKKLLVPLICLLALVCLVGSASATNLVTNGDFELGNTGFTSGYAYMGLTDNPDALWPEGTYAVGDNPLTYHSSWSGPAGSGFPAHGGSGLMMIVNGDTTAGVEVWKQTGITVLANTDYVFSAYAASCFATSPAVLAFSINDTPIGTMYLTSNIGQWDLFSVTWNSGSSTTANFLALVNQNTIANGNDFCLDDISMTPVPVPPTVILLGSGLLGLGLLRRKWSLKK